MNTVKGHLPDYQYSPSVDPLLKLTDVIGDRKRGIPGLIPMSRSKWYDGIKRQIFPPALHIGCGSYWRLSSIQAVIEKAASQDQGVTI